MNNKGFTLVELLGVIVIISLLTLVASVAVVKVVKDTKSDLSDIQIKAIESAAQAWGADNITLLPDAGDCIYLYLSDLQDYGLIDSDIIDPKDNEKIETSLKIKISGTNSSKGKVIINYEVNAGDVSKCKYISDLSTV